jgi:hypothetical protein
VFWPLLRSRTAQLESRRLMSPQERLVEGEKILRFYTNLALLIAIAVGVSVIIGHRGTITAGLTAFGAALGLGGVLGFLFGVPGPSRPPVNINANTIAVGSGEGSTTVSGTVEAGETPVPPPGQTGSSSNANPAPPPEPPVKPPPVTGAVELPTQSQVPSNLEQVADWVTKLLLGGGLTQMQRIPPKVWQWSRMVALGILRDDPTASEQLIVAQQAFAAGLLVYGFVLGFFAGFLITKLQLGKSIS